jgi:hypothetical protein
MPIKLRMVVGLVSVRLAASSIMLFNVLLAPLSRYLLCFLLPYSPELNPVEKLWQYMKNHILKNRVYDLLEDLEDIVCKFIQGFDNDTIKSVCNVSYMPYYL